MCIFSLETVLKLILPLLGYALLPCHSERSGVEGAGYEGE